MFHSNFKHFCPVLTEMQDFELRWVKRRC